MELCDRISREVDSIVVAIESSDQDTGVMSVPEFVKPADERAPTDGQYGVIAVPPELTDDDE